MIIKQTMTTAMIAMLAILSACQPKTESEVLDLANQLAKPQIQSFTANPASVKAGDPVTLTFANIKATNVIIEPGGHDVLGKSQLVVHPHETTTYKLISTNDVATAEASVTVVVADQAVVVPAPEVTSISASAASIVSGSPVTINWVTKNATSLVLNPGNINVTGKTSQSVSPTSSTQYSVTAINSAGQVSRNVYVTVTQAPAPQRPVINSFSASPSSVTAGTSVSLNFNVSGATSMVLTPGNINVNGLSSYSLVPTASTTYTLTATNAAGATAQQIGVTVNPAPTRPTISSFSASPSSITSGSATTLNFNVSGATSAVITPGNINVQGKASQSVTPTANTTYTLTASNAVGTISASTSVTVRAPAPVISSFTASSSAITAGQSVRLNYAVANATTLVLNPGNINVTGTTSRSVTPTATTTYTITATGNGTANRSVSVTVGPASTPTQPTGTSYLPAVNVALIPTGDPGSSTRDIHTLTSDEMRYSSNRTLPAPDGIGAFRTRCEFSHMSFEDPIVFPGQPNKSHLHTFFGNTSINAYTTAANIRQTGNSTCRGGIANRSGYWVPTVIDTSSGRPIRPIVSDFYYKTGYRGVQNSAITTPPAGLRMIAGNSKAVSEADVGSGQISEWHCTSNGRITKSIPAVCPAGSPLYQRVFFPQCWNGRDLDSADHKSHMAYAGSGGCPSTHPIAIPLITLEVQYEMTGRENLSAWRLSSDNYPTNLPGGYSNHGDWFNGWEQEIIETFSTRCVKAGMDCHSHLLGDGRSIE